MKVTNLDDVLKSLDEATATIERKLKAVVRGYVLDATRILVENTPYGSITNPNSGTLSEWYERRSKSPLFGPFLDEAPGTARNSWKVSFLSNFSGVLSNNVVFSGSPSSGKTLESGSQAGELSFMNVNASLDHYKLGDLVVLFNNTPYIANRKDDWSLGVFGKSNAKGLEYGSSPQAPMGISQPSVEEIVALYRAGANIKRNFDGG